MNPTPPDTKLICQNCRFWNDSLMKAAFDEYGTCSNQSLFNNQSPIKFDDIRVSGLVTQTGKDFGCIHFEKKD